MVIYGHLWPLCWYIPTTVYNHSADMPYKTHKYQIPPNTAKYRQIPPNTAKYRQIPPNTAKYRQIPPNTAKYRQIPPNTADAVPTVITPLPKGSTCSNPPLHCRQTLLWWHWSLASPYDGINCQDYFWEYSVFWPGLRIFFPVIPGNYPAGFYYIFTPDTIGTEFQNDHGINFNLGLSA